MIFSINTLIMTTLMCSFLIIVLSIGLNWRSFPLDKTVKAVPFFILLIIIRLLFPAEFNFTTTIRSTNIMPFLQEILSYNIAPLNISFQNILLIIWGLTAIIKSIQFFKKYKKFRIALDCLPTETKYNEVILHIMNGRDISHIKVKIMPEITSPAIVGLLKPIIILPDISLNETEVYYILSHELQHLKQGDLWKKAACELIRIIYWWNPSLKLLKKQLTMATELNADLAVTRNFNNVERASYLNCLLKIAKIKKANPNESFSLAFYKENKMNFAKRFKIILSSRPFKTTKNFILVNIFLGWLLMTISYSIIFEPYILTPEIMGESFEIDSESSYIIKHGKEYHLYVKNKYSVTLTFQDLDMLNNIPVYNNIAEVPK